MWRDCNVNFGDRHSYVYIELVESVWTQRLNYFPFFFSAHCPAGVTCRALTADGGHLPGSQSVKYGHLAGSQSAEYGHLAGSQSAEYGQPRPGGYTSTTASPPPLPQMPRNFAPLPAERWTAEIPSTVSCELSTTAVREASAMFSTFSPVFSCVGCRSLWPYGGGQTAVKDHRADRWNSCSTPSVRLPPPTRRNAQIRICESDSAASDKGQLASARLTGKQLSSHGVVMFTVPKII